MAESQTPVTLSGLMKLQSEVTDAFNKVEQADKEVVSATKRAAKKRLEWEGLKAKLEKSQAEFEKTNPAKK